MELIVEGMKENFLFESEWFGEGKETMEDVAFWDKTLTYYYNVQVAFSTTFMAVWTLFSGKDR